MKTTKRRFLVALWTLVVAGPWQIHTLADQREATGQNSQPTKVVGATLLEQQQGLEVIGKFTRFSVMPAHQENFKKAMAHYVSQALADEGNIQAEAYHEQDKPAVMWLVERWKNKGELERFGHSQSAKTIDSLKGEALSAEVETHHVTDLEPLSKQQWRRTARAEDRPLTVVLFVDAREGTQEDFKATYHLAMPQFRSEPGVVTYQLSQVQGDGTKFVTFEKFRSQEAFQYHLRFPPIKPVLQYLQTSIKKQPFQAGLHLLTEFAPMTRE